MPLTSISKVYKNFPTFFAEKVTEHVRKRSDTFCRGDGGKKLEEEATGMDNEVTSFCAPRPPMRRPTPARPSSDSRPELRVLTTKRSETPLGVMSDADSDSESPKPRLVSGSTRETPPPRPNTVSYFDATVNYLTKPRWPKSSPRTCTSLDNVDLWESDEESDQGCPPGFDKINGVAINPNKTIDFSELHSEIRRSRSPVSCKRNKLEKPSVPHASHNHRDQRLDRLVPDPKAKTGALKNSGILPAIPKSYNKPSKRESHKDHERLPPELKETMDERKMANILQQVNTHGVKRRSSKPSIPSYKRLETAAGRSDAALTHTQHKPSPPPSRTPLATKPLTATYTTTSKFSTTEYAQLRMRQNNRSPDPSVPSSIPAMASTDSPNTIARKVKFQNYVTVREGEESTTEDLRNSNNSAQQYKQMYLGGGGDVSTPSPHAPLAPYNPANYEDSEDSMDQSRWRLEMVC